MATIPEALAIAIEHHQAGRLPAAEQIYRQILAVMPAHADALQLLGVIAHQVGKQQLAIDYIAQAIAVNGNVADYHNNLGEAHRALGQVTESIACYRRALELKPDLAEAHNNLGNALREDGQTDEALACYRRATELNPGYAEAHNNLGILWKDRGELVAAEACYRRALELKPDYGEAHNNLGVLLWDRKEWEEAAQCCRRAIALKPDLAEAHNNMGTLLSDKALWDEAVACFQRALQLKPDYVEAINNLGILSRNRGDLATAVSYYRAALERRPNYAEAHNNLGVALLEQGKLTDAAECFGQAIQHKPDYAEAHNNLGMIWKDLGKLEEAIVCHRKALEFKPDYVSALSSLVHTQQHLCRWDDLESLSRRVIEQVENDVVDDMNSAVPPFTYISLPVATSAEQQARCARQWVQRQLKSVQHTTNKIVRDRPSHKSKLTIGYLSADYRSHAVAYLIAELFEKHDRDRFSILGYSCGPDDGSPIRKRIVQAFDRVWDVRPASFAETAERIAQDEVDILVDLTGYTAFARTQVLAMRPAPIQVNFLGYPGTLGAPFIDYILVDPFIVPPSEQPHYNEQLVHLPDCYQVNDSQREIAEHTPSRAECGLPEDGFVFCSFNNSFKITPEVFDVWMNLLKATPGSVLWLFEGNSHVPDNLRREAAARGVAPERLVFAPRIGVAEHLARHRLADLFLDTFPYNAHTTASDSLWAGCPLVTRAGETFPARVAGSILRTAGLPELVTESIEQYRELALRLAHDREALASLRARLAANRASSPLFDCSRFARHIEQAYRTMWDIHVAGEPPRPFAVVP